MRENHPGDLDGSVAQDALKVALSMATGSNEISSNDITVISKRVHRSTDADPHTDPHGDRRRAYNCGMAAPDTHDCDLVSVDFTIAMPWTDRKVFLEKQGMMGNMMYQMEQNLGTPEAAAAFFTATTGGLLDVTIVGNFAVFESKASTFMEDPHMRSGHGDTFDFRGEHGAIYNLLSHANTSLNVLFEHVDYWSPGIRRKVVHGSYQRAVYVTVVTNASRTLRLEYAAAHPLATKLSIDGIESLGGPQVTVDNVMIWLKDRTLTLRTPEWLVHATSKVNPHITNATTCATGRCILNLNLEPLFDTDHAKVAPHGLIGQSYDADELAVIGKVDRYSYREITTSAMGEGAIEGVAAQYKMTSKFATEFAFSRFGKTSALPRNVSAMSGRKIPRNDDNQLHAA